MAVGHGHVNLAVPFGCTFILASTLQMKTAALICQHSAPEIKDTPKVYCGPACGIIKNHVILYTLGTNKGWPIYASMHVFVLSYVIIIQRCAT